MDHAIRVSNLTKSFDGLLAVNHVSFSVRKGEVFGFLGPNGAGKTTTIRMLTGVIKPDEGTAIVMGHDVQKRPSEVKQSLGIAPEMANAYVDLSAWNNLIFIGELYGIPKAVREKKAKDLLKTFALYERRGQLAKGFSKGMLKRLIICMALINDAPILLLDEPTAGLDVQSSRLIRDIIRRLNENENVTIFLTTHNLNEAEQMCDRVAIINRGQIVALDSPNELRSRISRVQYIEVSFDQDVAQKELEGIRGVRSVRRIGGRFRLYTDDTGSLVMNVVDYAKSSKLKIVSISALQPSLEDVFVELVGEDVVKSIPHVRGRK